MACYIVLFGYFVLESKVPMEVLRCQNAGEAGVWLQNKHRSRSGSALHLHTSEPFTLAQLGGQVKS